MPDEPKTESHSGTPDAGAHPAPTAEDRPVEAAPPAPPHEGDVEDDEEDDGPENAASPDAILKRVSALGEEDESERIARAEEAKLEERRKSEKKAKKRGKGGLEASASKRLSSIGDKSKARRAAEEAAAATAVEPEPYRDPGVDFAEWAKKNQSVVTGVVAAAVLGLAGFFGYAEYQHRRESAASVQLAKAVEDEHGRIGDPDKEEEPDRPHDPTPVFKTVEDRREAALAGYRGVESKYAGTGAAILARLSEGSLLLDKEDADGALAAYNDVSTSPLAKADAEVRGRALEGLGFANELKADAQTGDAAKGLLDKAAQEYRELTNTDVDGFKELGMYHQARILAKEGQKDEAVDMLKKLHERLHKGGADDHPFVDLEQVADDALRSLAPDALPPKSSGMGSARGGRGGKLDSAQLQRLMEQMQKNGGKLPGAPAKAPQ